jgi:hypothetical protein
MSSQSPGSVLYDFNGNPLAVQNATAIPASTPALLMAGSDGTDSRYLTIDTSGRLEMVGAAAVGAAPSGNPLYLAGVQPNGNLIGLVASADGSLGISEMTNINYVQSNATLTTTGSTVLTANYFGTQQINLIVNVTNSPTGTTPSMTVTIAEVDPGNGTTTFGNSASTSAITTTGVFTASLSNTHSDVIKVTWTISGTTPSFTGVYITVLSKSTPDTQVVSGTVTATNPSVGTDGAAALGFDTQVGGIVSASNPTYTAGNLNALSLDTSGRLRVSALTNKATTSAVTSVASSTSNTTVLASNASRVFASIWNGSNKLMYAKLGTTASTSSYSIQILPGSYWEVPNDYTGEIDAVWANGTSGNALVTELTP